MTEITKIPDIFRTHNNVNRKVLKRGIKSFVCSHDRGAPYIVLERILLMNDMGNVTEQLTGSMRYERFQTEAEALQYFKQAELGGAFI